MGYFTINGTNRRLSDRFSHHPSYCICVPHFVCQYKSMWSMYYSLYATELVNTATCMSARSFTVAGDSPSISRGLDIVPGDIPAYCIRIPHLICQYKSIWSICYCLYAIELMDTATYYNIF